MSDRRCTRLEEHWPEVALGVADAEVRAAALAHAEHCPHCRRELAELAEVADALAALAPHADPPAGFESKVLAAITAASAKPPVAPTRMARRWVAAAAAAVALGAGAAGWSLGHRSSTPPPASTAVTSAALTAAGAPVGQVVVSAGSNPWMSVRLNPGVAVGVVTCEVEGADGATGVVGMFSPNSDYGYWAAPLPAKVRRPVAVRIVDTQQRVVATAALANRR